MKVEHSYSEEHDLWEYMNEAYHLIARYRAIELRPYNISRSQARILWIVQSLGDEATLTRISRPSWLRSQSTSMIVKRMEKSDLLKRSKSPGTNAGIIKLTEKGLQACRASLKMESVHKVMSVLTTEQRQQLRSCLEILIDTVKKEIALSEYQFFRPSELLSSFEESE